MSKRRRRLDRSTVFQTTIESLSHDGRGIAHVNGKTVFIFGALKGEEVSYTYTASHRRFDEAQAIEIQSASIHRVTPRCEYFGQCGGCALQHMSHEHQLSSKQVAVAQQLKQVADLEPDVWLPPLTDHIWGYRRKARLSARYVDKKQTMMLGFRERDGRFVLNMRDCQVLHPAIAKHIGALRDLLVGFDGRLDIPQIEVVVANVVAIIVRHLKPLSHDDLSKLSSFCATHAIHLYLQPGDFSTIHKHWPENSPFLMHYKLPSQQLALYFPPHGFIQVNDAINQKMINQLLNQLDLQGNERVLDLFCGIGNLSLPMARFAKSVVGVEGSELSVDQAMNNAKHNGLNNTEFFVGDLEKDQQSTSWFDRSYDVVVLDPPRSGALNIIGALSRWQPSLVAYVSCHPMSFARDAALVVKQGYHLKCMGIMDMFSHTQHVECMAFFERKG